MSGGRHAVHLAGSEKSEPTLKCPNRLSGIMNQLIEWKTTMKPHSPLSEQAMCTLEENIPKMAQAAFERARLNALTVSGKVLQVLNGQLVELSAEGDIRVIKDIQPSIKVQVGTKLVRKLPS